jgi:hypothetical protein
MPRLLEETFGAGDQSWLASTHGIYECRTVPLDISAFTEGVHYPDGYIKSGYPLGQITASGLYGPYTGDSTDEVQTVTEGGSGLTSFTLTLSGHTTGSIAAAAAAATVQAALEALTNVGAGNVAVSGSAGGPYTVTFQGDLANTNVAQMTATPTGGTGTVTVATQTAGGADASSDGREVLAGFLYTDQKVVGTSDFAVPLLDHGKVKVDNLPIQFAATGHNTTGLFVFVGGVA